MQNILSKLHRDHLNFIKLLDYLEEQHRLLEKCENTDLELVLDAIWYMKEYPDLVHHPLENVVFKYFLQHYADAQEDIDALLHEHEEMPELTNKLLGMLRGALVDVPQSREELCAYLKEYISVQKEHMNEEEARIYPLLNSKLNENDWQKIDSELAHIEDPLFGNKVEKSYQNLLQYVVG
jgi:hemerythrin-like domain-containing protein